MPINYSTLSKKLSRISYLFGIASMLAAMILSIVSHPVQAQNTDPCGTGFEVKFEGSGPFQYTTDPGYVISMVTIKSGTQCMEFTEDVEACYVIYGIGTNSVYIGGGGTSKTCQEISHVLIYTSPVETPPVTETPTETPTVRRHP
jgi:hypothetical protein